MPAPTDLIAFDGDAVERAILTAIGAVNDRVAHYRILLAEPDLYSIADPGALRTSLADDQATIDVLRWVVDKPRGF
jgi:hypothetical protein